MIALVLLLRKALWRLQR